MRVVVITPPEPVVSTEEALQHLKQDSDDDALLVDAYVAAATAHLDGPDGWLGRALGVQTLEARCDVFRDAMQLSYGPVLDMVSVKYLTGAGDVATVQPGDYELRGWLLGSSFGRRWPSVGGHAEAVRLQYRAGYETVPTPIKAAILLMTGDLYRNRSTATDKVTAKVEMSTTVANLLAPFRVWR